MHWERGRGHFTNGKLGFYNVPEPRDCLGISNVVIKHAHSKSTVLTQNFEFGVFGQHIHGLGEREGELYKREN